MLSDASFGYDSYLFRGMCSPTEWVFGNLLLPSIASMTGQSLRSAYICKVSTTGALEVPIRVKASTVCRCTGLFDKNGCLLFECDILCADNVAVSELPNAKARLYVLRYGRFMSDGVFLMGFYLEFANNPSVCIGFSESYCEDLGVVGNIFFDARLLS